jgi:hypothetical protein
MRCLPATTMQNPSRTWANDGRSRMWVAIALARVQQTSRSDAFLHGRDAILSTGWLAVCCVLQARSAAMPNQLTG